MPPAIAIPLVLAAGGMIGQNVQNKANLKNAENARSAASGQIGTAQQNAMNFWQNQPKLQAPNMGGPSSFGGGSVGGPSGGTITGGQYGQPPPGQVMTPQMIQQILQHLGGRTSQATFGGNQGGPGMMTPPHILAPPQVLPPSSPLAGFAGVNRGPILPGNLPQ